MSRNDLKDYLKTNPLPEDQVRLIESTLKALNGLQAVGVAPHGYALAAPYGHKGGNHPPASKRKSLPVSTRKAFGRRDPE